VVFLISIAPIAIKRLKPFWTRRKILYSKLCSNFLLLFNHLAWIITPGIVNVEIGLVHANVGESRSRIRAVSSWKVATFFLYLAWPLPMWVGRAASNLPITLNWRRWLNARITTLGAENRNKRSVLQRRRATWLRRRLD